MSLSLQRPSGEPCPSCNAHPRKPCKPGCSSIYHPPRPGFFERLRTRLFAAAIGVSATFLAPDHARAQTVEQTVAAAGQQSPEEWIAAAEDARNVGGMPYAFQVDEVAHRLAAKCERIARNARAARFVWLGRIMEGGVPVVNVIASPTDSRMGDCFVAAVKRTTFPEPPQPEYYDRFGGHPVAWQWEPSPSAVRHHHQRKP